MRARRLDCRGKTPKRLRIQTYDSVGLLQANRSDQRNITRLQACQYLHCFFSNRSVDDVFQERLDFAR